MSDRVGLGRIAASGLAAAVALAAIPAVVAAQEPTPTPSAPPTPPIESPPPAPPWPSGDELRRDLQQIDFSFRIDGDTGDWLGWAPRADGGEAPALGLDGAGTRDAVASFDFTLIGGDSGPALTALMEVAARVPVARSDVDQARRFVVDDLLEAPPETMDDCYLSDWDRGAALAVVDREAGTAQLHLASSAALLEPDSETDLVECAAFVPAEVVAELGDPSSERMTIAISGDPAAFDPAETRVEGALVTLILTFRNDSDVDQSLTFEAPISASTGAIPPGGLKLIVVRELEPGEYPFYSESDPDAVRGTVIVERPVAD